MIVKRGAGKFDLSWEESHAMEAAKKYVDSVSQMLNDEQAHVNLEPRKGITTIEFSFGLGRNNGRSEGYISYFASYEALVKQHADDHRTSSAKTLGHTTYEWLVKQRAALKRLDKYLAKFELDPKSNG